MADVLSQPNKEKKILCSGIACVDVVVTVDDYPEEDHVIKGVEPHWQRGGNASNDCTVLSCLECPCEQLSSFVGTKGKRVEDNFYTQFILNDMKECGINFEHCVYYENFHCPMSQIVLSANSGSRTIVYTNPDLPEVTVSDLQKLNLEDYNWAHFEGRGAHQAPMMMHIREWNEKQPPADRIPISLEMELPFGVYEETAPCVDYVFVSKELAQNRGLKNKEDAINKFWIPLREGATLIFPWGAEGAAFRCGSDGDIRTVKAYPPPNGVVDTLGAGDSFISSTIYALSRGHPIEKAIDFGCRMAGYKVGVFGLRCLKDVATSIYKQCFG